MTVSAPPDLAVLGVLPAGFADVVLDLVLIKHRQAVSEIIGQRHLRPPFRVSAGLAM